MTSNKVFISSFVFLDWTQEVIKVLEEVREQKINKYYIKNLAQIYIS